MQDANIPKSVITDALKVLIGNESSIPNLCCQWELLISFFEMTLIFYETLDSFADVRNHPVLIHCKRGKVCCKSSLGTKRTIFLALG